MSENNINTNKKRILIGCTGSVAAIKLPELVQILLKEFENDSTVVDIAVVSTSKAEHFFKKEELPSATRFYSDKDEWDSWKSRGDPVLHIELAKWADIMIISPLDANTLAKMAHGICDNLLTCITRAWIMTKPLLFCPAMNTRMWEHPITAQQVDLLKSWGHIEIPPIEKTLICGDTGVGAMAELITIVEHIKDILKR